MLNHRERVLKTLNGEPIDRIARGEFFLAEEFVRAFLSLADDAPVGHHERAAVVEQLDCDIAAVSFSEGWGALQQPNEDRALESLVRWRAESDRFVVAVIDGPFSAGTKVVGFDAMMKYIHSIPHVATDYYRQGGEDAVGLAQAVRDAGADGVLLGEDLAYNRSTFFSPQQLRDCYFPALADTVQRIHDLGLAVFFHSDGNLKEILADLVASDLDGVQGLEPAAGMSIPSARAQVGNKLTLWGNFSFEFLSDVRSDEEIANALSDITQSGEKIILSSCGGLVDGLNIETVRRVYRAIG